MCHKRYVITTAVPGAKVNADFYASIKTFCKKRDAKLIILMAQKIYNDDIIDSSLLEEKLVNSDLKLNDRIRISGIPINPQAIDPITGLDRQTHREGSFIFASPKQRLKVVPTAGKLPYVLMTTGAITKPYYRATRNGIMASSDHLTGGIIVETNGPTEYHFRQIQAAKDGSFVDLGVQYSKNTIKPIKTTALVPGDWHSGETDQKIISVIEQMIKTFKPQHLILHDFFNGLSVNPHIENKILTMSKINNSLEAELQQAYKDLAKLSALAKNIVIVRSNHDLFLDRWLQEAKYHNDKVNHIIGLELALAKAKGENPIEYYMNQLGELTNVQYLKIDEEFKLTPQRIECGAHGHIGSNGSRASTSGLEKAYGKSITGHSHTPEILRGSYVVGTSTKLRLDYNTGPSSWMNTMCVLYEDGSRQLLNIINGRYHG